MLSLRRISGLLGATAAVALSTACLELPPSSPQFPNPATGKRVLFIGNSLTYTNDLPIMVQGLADAAGGDSLVIAMVAGPNMALVDHWYRSEARSAIGSGHWDYVVLQQGPSSTVINRDSLRTLTVMFAARIKNSGGRTVLFSAWPASDRRQDFDRAAESYRLAAEDVRGLYAPVANAWIEAWNRNPDLSLYADGLHGNVTGSYLAALVIYSTIFQRSPIGLPATFKLRTGGSLSFPAELNALLQEAAWAAVLPTLTPEGRPATPGP
jgi:hypothetical protein